MTKFTAKSLNATIRRIEKSIENPEPLPMAAPTEPPLPPKSEPAAPLPPATDKTPYGEGEKSPVSAPNPTENVTKCNVLLPDDLYAGLQQLRLERGKIPLRTLCLQLIQERYAEIRHS